MEIRVKIRAIADCARRFGLSLPERRWFRFFVLWLAPFLVLQGFFLAAITKGSNYLEIFPGELVIPSVMNAVTALLLASLAYKVRRPQLFGAKLFVVLVLSVLFTNYESRLQSAAGVLRTFMPSFFSEGEDWLFLSIVFIVLLVLLALWLGRLMEGLQNKYSYPTSRNVTAGFLIFTGVVMGGTVLQMGSMLPTIANQAGVVPKPLPSPKQAAQAGDKPDIYYIVVDRYTNQDVLSGEFGYDNSQFVDFLRSNDFMVQDSAAANYPFTDMSIASMLNAGYLREYTQAKAGERVQSHALYQNLIRQSSVIQAMKNAGYSYTLVGSWYNASSQAPLADARYARGWNLQVAGKEKALTSLEGSELIKSPYYRFLKSGLLKQIAHMSELNNASLLDEQMRSLQQIAETPSAGGRFIFAHMLTAHPPYFFNADGSYSSYPSPDNTGKLVRAKYTDQIEHTNTYLTKLVSTIKEKSGGKAVIILASDEGPHPDEMNPGAPAGVNISDWSDDWLRMKFGVLQAAHIPKATGSDMEKLSNVNLFRIVLNRYFGMNLEYLPQCNVFVPEGRDRQFVQSDVTGRISGEGADPFCATVVSGAK